MKKKLTFRGQPVKISAESYQVNGTLALMLTHRNGDIDVLTVNLGNPFQSETRAFLDTNNYPDAESFILENGLGTATGITARSGFCLYPLYVINTDSL